MTESHALNAVFGLEPRYQEYVWGGQRLRPGQRTAEAWAVYEGDTISSGPLTGQTLAEAAQRFGAALLGKRVFAQTGLRFPLLVKLLDCADWLSIQVHPNDEQAVRLEGPGHFGKTEAWHILQADPGAEIVCGFQPGVAEQAALNAVSNGLVLDYAQKVSMQAGQTVLIRPGTMHALGPGLLVYEVQQTSNITYRVFDWNRPASAGRALHITQSIDVLRPENACAPVPLPPYQDGNHTRLVQCPYFDLDLLTGEHITFNLNTHRQTFHILTVAEGAITVQGQGWSRHFAVLQSAVVPANVGEYQIVPQGRVRVLKASVEAER